MNLQQLDTELRALLQTLIEAEPTADQLTQSIHPDFRRSAKNLYRYLLLRSYDLRRYHDSLSDLGISSLRSAEAYVFSNLYQVLKMLRLLQEKPLDIDSEVETIGYKGGQELLRTHTRLLFGETDQQHRTEIMVTLPNEAAEDKKLILKMVRHGMDIARINLSHGNLDIWTKMVQLIQEIREETGKAIKIYMDLSGPKIRTATIEMRGKKGKVKKSIPIRVGEHILLTKQKTLGKKSAFDKKGNQKEKAEIGVQLHAIIDDVNIGDQVFFDDGMIRAKVVAKKKKAVELEITACYKNKLSSHKGINLPNTNLNLPALTERDLELLPFVCQHADMLGYSFVRTAEDVQTLYQRLEAYGNTDIGVIFKIENQQAFENLPVILLEGMRRQKIGVMIARGDLAVEIGFERLSEIQEEILWICEAAHVPVVWATQVLESLNKNGIA
ncbi:MAG: pyruvate kinase, partial [Phaeodactylibacter sp.]|nr:pyruvate kinase [Phaeodactylibacter sp.]